MEDPHKGITVIIPSVGRETLKATLASLVYQLTEADAVVVISEGENYETNATVYALADCYPDLDLTYIERQGGCWGHPNRNYALDHHVHTSHVWTLDDDDQAAPGAIETLRKHMDDPWTIFRMTFGPGHPANGVTCWRYKQIMLGDIGTPMVFAPHTQARYGHEYSGDFTYAQNLHDLLGEPVWAEDVVSLIRP